MNTTNNTVTMTFPDGTPSIELPLHKGSLGSDAIDISRLYSTTSKVTLDPGFMSTAPCTSSITYIDGENGELLYRGYPIEDLAVKCSFTEVCHLLLKGELPTEAELNVFEKDIKSHSMLHEQMQFFFRGFRRDAHPMSVLVATVGALASFYHDEMDISVPEQRAEAALRLIAAMPTLVAMAYKYSIGQPFVYPRNDLSYSANFMNMMFSTPAEEYEINDVLVRAVDRIMLLHADHEQNASTSTVRLAGSSGANPFACIAAGIACLWGPAHGGANEAALRMVKEIGTVDNVADYVQRVKNREDGVRLMGFGHRVYKSYDPRAMLMRETCHEVLTELGLENDPLFEIALEIERVALEDEFFLSRGLYPNVDFYSGIVQSALGIPVNLFTGIFAMSRTVGWISQWKEMIGDPNQRIGRPRQLYTGETRRDVPSFDKRG